jgi:hypothetical protein
MPIVSTAPLAAAINAAPMRTSKIFDRKDRSGTHFLPGGVSPPVFFVMSLC